LVAQIEKHYQSGKFDKALEISARALESNPVDLKACGSRWRLIAGMFSEEEARKKICSEIESLLRTHPETPEVLEAAYGGYRSLPGGAKNVPSSLFDRMLQYPRTRVYQNALLGLAGRSQDACQK
jgi:tetratricopeptide (TPR) repeat protein